MSTRSALKEKFKGLDKVTMPIFVTDTDGIVLYKNEYAGSNYNFRVGSNILRYANANDSNVVKKLSAKGLMSAVVLGCDVWTCVCAVVPKVIDGNTYCIYSSIPYAYDFMDGSDDISFLTEENENRKYFNELEKLIANMMETVDGGEYELSEKESKTLKYNAQKLMRLEKRLKDRIFTSGRDREYSLNSSYFYSDSIELCSFADIMSKNINSLSAVLGFSLIYVSKKDYSICKCRSCDLAKLFVYLSVFCLKFGEGRDTTVWVEESAGDSVLVFKPRIRNSVLENAASFDIEYISASANAHGFKLVCTKGEEYVESISVHISADTTKAYNALSSANYLFDVSADFIEKVFDEAQCLIGYEEN